MFSDLSYVDLGIFFLAMLVSVSAHEAMHAFTAHYLGDDTAEREGRLTLNPLKHIDLITTVLLPVMLVAVHLPPIFVAKPVPFNPENVRYREFGAALVGLAGPFTNLALAVVASLVLRFGSLDWDGQVLNALAIFMQVNIALFVFNMIPIPPLDGSRLLYALAPDGLRRVMFQLEQMGLVVTLMIILLLSPFLLPVVQNVTDAIYSFLLR